MGVKVSVIVPVYNVERYLDECLSSIACQTMSDFEAILVNDGSNDGSVDIMRNWCEKDGRFRVVDRPHTNGGSARNAGMAVAVGEYLSFLDSDDVFSPHLLEVLLQGAQTFGADVSCCRYTEFIDGDCLPQLSDVKETAWVDCTPDAVERANIDSVGAVTWDKLYRRQFILDADIQYVEQPSTNDITFVWTALSVASKVVATQSRLIAYRRHRASTQGRKSSNPECVIVANRSYINELRRLGVMTKRPWIFEEYLRRKPAGYLTYLRTMGTRRAYLTAYCLICCFFRDYDVLGGDRAAMNNESIRRAKRMMKNSFGEKLQRTIESYLATISVRRVTSGRMVAAGIRLLDILILGVFDPYCFFCRVLKWVRRHT